MTAKAFSPPHKPQQKEQHVEGENRLRQGEGQVSGDRGGKAGDAGGGKMLRKDKQAEGHCGERGAQKHLWQRYAGLLEAL